MTKKTFIPFYEVKKHAGDVLVVDAHHPQGFDLSHWRGAPIPPGCEADTSTEIVLKALKNNLPELDKHFISNNHFDIDGFLGVWSLFNPEQAINHSPLLIEIAQIADFREIDFNNKNWRKALKLVCWINQVEAEKFYPPFGAPEIAEKEMEACLVKYHYFLEEFEDILILSLDDIPETKEYELVLRQIAESPHTEQLVSLRIQVVQEHKPLHYYSLYAGSQYADIVISLYANNSYELEYKYTTWVQTTRAHFPRIDLKPLAKELNHYEKSEFLWDAEHFTDTAPILRLHGKDLTKKERFLSPVDRPIYSSTIPPEQFKNICLAYFTKYYAQLEKTNETKSWQELRELNERLFKEKL